MTDKRQRVTTSPISENSLESPETFPLCKQVAPSREMKPLSQPDDTVVETDIIPPGSSITRDADDVFVEFANRPSYAELCHFSRNWSDTLDPVETDIIPPASQFGAHLDRPHLQASDEKDMTQRDEEGCVTYPNAEPQCIMQCTLIDSDTHLCGVSRAFNDSMANLVKYSRYPCKGYKKDVLVLAPMGSTMSHHLSLMMESMDHRVYTNNLSLTLTKNIMYVAIRYGFVTDDLPSVKLTGVPNPDFPLPAKVVDTDDELFVLDVLCCNAFIYYTTSNLEISDGGSSMSNSQIKARYSCKGDRSAAVACFNSCVQWVDYRTVLESMGYEGVVPGKRICDPISFELKPLISTRIPLISSRMPGFPAGVAKVNILYEVLKLMDNCPTKILVYQKDDFLVIPALHADILKTPLAYHRDCRYLTGGRVTEQIRVDVKHLLGRAGSWISGAQPKSSLRNAPCFKKGEFEIYSWEEKLMTLSVKKMKKKLLVKEREKS